MTSESIGSGGRSLRKQVEDNLALWALGLLLAGFLAGYRVRIELQRVQAAKPREAEQTATAPGPSRATNVLDRYIVMVGSYSSKGAAFVAARGLLERGFDARVYESDNGSFALGFAAISRGFADRLREQLIDANLADQDAYVSTATKLRTRWLVETSG